jgi:hypothetical protein
MDDVDKRILGDTGQDIQEGLMDMEITPTPDMSYDRDAIQEGLPDMDIEPTKGEFDHLTAMSEDVNAGDTLEIIAGLGERLKEKLKEKEELEREMKDLNKEITELSRELIPQTMISVGMSEFKLVSGEKVSFKEELSASVKDADRFYNFLEERGDAALMKIQLEIGKVPQTILSKIVKVLNQEFGIMASTKKAVHPQTLKKYIKELCGIGGDTEVEAEIPLSELDSTMVSTFVYYKTTVK